jgi:hypothetical protein
LRSVAPGCCATVAAGVADRVADQRAENRAKSKLLRCCASTGQGRWGIEGLGAPGERATEGRHVASEDTFLTLGMQRWRIGMRLRNVRTPGEGGAGGRQNSVGESLLRGQSAAGPNARGARCPSAADQSSVFNRHNALVDWAVGRNLRRSYCIDFGCAAIALSSALSALCVCGFDSALSNKRPMRISQRRTHLATRARRRLGQARLTRPDGPISPKRRLVPSPRTRGT